MDTADDRSGHLRLAAVCQDHFRRFAPRGA